MTTEPEFEGECQYLVVVHKLCLNFPEPSFSVRCSCVCMGELLSSIRFVVVSMFGMCEENWTSSIFHGHPSLRWVPTCVSISSRSVGRVTKTITDAQIDGAGHVCLILLWYLDATRPPRRVSSGEVSLGR